MIELNDEKRKAEDMLKNKLITPLVPALPRLNGKHTIDTDACDSRVRCILLQIGTQGSKVLRLLVSLVVRCEKRDDTTPKKCLAVLWAVLLQCPYLEGSHFIVKTES